MSEKQYVSPPSNKKNIFSKAIGFIKGVYENLDREYRNSLIIQQIILIPILFFANIIIFGLILPLSFGLEQYYNQGFADVFIGIIVWILVIFLTLTAIIFYPYSIYWYTHSSFYRFFENLYFFGGFFQVIVRKLLMVLGHIFIAGLLSPIIGIMTWKKIKRENTIIFKAKS